MCLGLSVSCVEEFPISTDEGNSAIVVYCILNEGYQQSLRLNYLGENGKTTKKAVDGARAWLCCRDTVIAFKQKDSYEWVCDYKPYYGQWYELKVFVPDRDTLRSFLLFPQDIRFTCGNARVCDPKDSRITLYYYSAYGISGNDQDSPNVTNYGLGYSPLKYDCNLWLVPVSTFTEDKLFEIPKGEYIATDHLGADDFNLYPGKITDCDNFNPDYLRSVGGSMEQYHSFVPKYFPNLKLHKNLLHIKHPADYINGDKKDSLLYPKSYIGTSMFVLMTDKARFVTADIQLNAYSVSDDYDKYLKKCYEKLYNRDNLVLEMYDTDAGYSNVYGGQGIFGAYIMRQVPLRTGFLWK